MITACSGLEGSNAQAACLKLLPECKILYVDSFRAVFEAVKSGKSYCGVVPIENSFNGSVRAVYELMIEYRFMIERELLLPIHHDLLAKPGVKLEDIVRVYSHTQALGQCSKFLESLGAKTIPFWNTAAAAKMVSESPERDIAAIASPLCAELYGLECLKSGIQDNNDNYTKFACVTKESRTHRRTDHISLIIGCENAPGSLNSILSVIASYGVNMNKLESCPISGRIFEYMFFIEIEASLEESGVREMLKEIESRSVQYVFLGSYELVNGGMN